MIVALVCALAVGPSLAAAPAAPPSSRLRLVQVPAEETGVAIRPVSGDHRAKRLILEENGSGLALLDFDFDGDLDLYVVNGGTLEPRADGGYVAHGAPNALYRNDGDWRFVDVTAKAGVGDGGWGVGVAAGDLDGDGSVDLFVTNFGPDALYLGRGDGSFREAAAEAGVADPGWGHSATFFDADGDADLDLYVARYLELDPAKPPKGGQPCEYQGLATACGPVGLPPQADRLFRNDGGRFTDVSEAVGIHAAKPEYGMGVVAVDLDRDAWIDLVVANDSGPNFLFRNRGDGSFEEQAWLAGVAAQADGRLQAGMGIDAGDADGDGELDLFITNFALDHSTLLAALGEGLFLDASYPSGLGGPTWTPMSWGTRFVDFDADSDLDLYVANGHLYPEVDGHGEESYRQADQLFENDGKGRFRDASAAIERARPAEVSRGAAFGDLDLDGDVDVAVLELESPPALYRNDSAAGHHLGVALRTPPGSSGEGATIVAVLPGGRRLVRPLTSGGSYASASEPVVRLGLGDASAVERLEVRWPARRRADGSVERKVRVLRGVAAGRQHVIE